MRSLALLLCLGCASSHGSKGSPEPPSDCCTSDASSDAMPPDAVPEASTPDTRESDASDGTYDAAPDAMDDAADAAPDATDDAYDAAPDARDDAYAADAIEDAGEDSADTAADADVDAGSCVLDDTFEFTAADSIRTLVTDPSGPTMGWTACGRAGELAYGLTTDTNVMVFIRPAPPEGGSFGNFDIAGESAGVCRLRSGVCVTVLSGSFHYAQPVLPAAPAYLSIGSPVAVTVPMRACAFSENVGPLIGTELVSLDTTAGFSRYTTSCAPTGGLEAVVYLKVRDATTLHVSWTQSGNHVFQLYEVCDDVYSGASCETCPVDCRSTEQAQDGSIDIGVTGWSAYFLVVQADAPGTEGLIDLSISAS